MSQPDPRSYVQRCLIGPPTVTPARRWLEVWQFLAHPEDVDDVVGGTCRVIGRQALRGCLIVVGRKRARHFGWERYARETLRVPEQIRERAQVQ